MKKLILVLNFFLFLFVCDTSLAESAGRALSQLDFDETPEPVPGLVDPAKIFGAQGTPSFNPQPVKPKAVEKKKAVKTKKSKRARLSTKKKKQAIKPKQLSGKDVLVPLKGPYVDFHSPSTITSSARWSAGRRGSCSNLSSDMQLCSKAKAVNEVLSRFAGEGNQAALRCQTTCPGNQRSVVTGVTLLDLDGGKFRFHKDSKGCGYQLSKAPSNAWSAVRVGRLNCSCLPVACVQ